MDHVSELLRQHYDQTFSWYGPCAQGVDWKDKETADIRYGKMAAVIRGDSNPTLLDVGCGYAGLFTYLNDLGVSIRYTGIDLVSSMIDYASNINGIERLICGDIMNMGHEKFDYVVCNGILTQKLSATITEMDRFTCDLIKRMWSLCTEGMAFNVMSTRVNWTVSRLYYRSPAEMLTLCQEITPYVKLDHTYPLHEYTVYLYREAR